MVKQFTDIPINRLPFKEKPETGSNFTVLVFLQYVISLMHQEVWFSQELLTEINPILTHRKISKSELITVIPLSIRTPLIFGHQ